MLSPPNTCAENNILDFMVLQRPSVERLQHERGAGEGHLDPNCAPRVGAKRGFSLVLKWGWTCGLLAAFHFLNISGNQSDREFTYG